MNSIDAPSPSVGLGRRIWALLRRPGQAWRAIGAEPPPSSRSLLFRLLPLTAVAPISRAVERFLHLRRDAEPPSVGIIGFIAAEAVVAWIMILLAVLGFGLAAWLLSGPFGGQANRRTALSLAAYASTPGWIGGIFYVFRPLNVITAGFVLYGLYVFYRGAEILVKPAGLRGRLGYVGLVISCHVVAVAMATALLKLLLALL